MEFDDSLGAYQLFLGNACYAKCVRELLFVFLDFLEDGRYFMIFCFWKMPRIRWVIVRDETCPVGSWFVSIVWTFVCPHSDLSMSVNMNGVARGNLLPRTYHSNCFRMGNEML